MKPLNTEVEVLGLQGAVDVPEERRTYQHADCQLWKRISIKAKME